MATESIQSVLNDITYRLSNMETKVRLTEQNSFNFQERVQLLSKNFLDLKKEILNRVDNLTQEAHDLERNMNDLKKKVAALEAKSSFSSYASGHAKLASVATPVHAEMSPEEAKAALDDVMRKLGA